MGDSRESLEAHNDYRSGLDTDEIRRLVTRAKQGDQGAFAKLVETFRVPIINLAYQILGSRADAEDVAQVTFVKAFRSLENYRQEAKFFSWLYRIATNAALDVVRHRRVLPTTCQDDIASWVTSDQDMENEEHRLTVSLALGRLPPSQRTVIVLREMYGLSYSEIAETLGISMGMVGARIRSARQYLQRVLQIPFADNSHEPRTRPRGKKPSGGGK